MPAHSAVIRSPSRSLIMAQSSGLRQLRPASRRRPVGESQSGKLTTLSCSRFLITRIMDFSQRAATKQTAGGEGREKKEGRRRARSAEIVYFSLAKRRKIKGKQETTTRDGGNQAGLRSGMDFPRGERRASSGWLADRRSGTRYTTRVTNRDFSMACTFARTVISMIFVWIFVGFHSTEPEFIFSLSLSSGFGILLQEGLNLN